MLKYMATVGYKPSIVEVEVERETDSCVFIKGRKHSKITEYQSYFDTWAQAKSHLIGYASHKEAAARSRWQGAQEELSRIEAMQPEKS